MPGNQVKDWHVYHECMKGKDGSDADKEYCAKVANAMASKHKEAADVQLIIQYSVEQATREVLSNDDRSSSGQGYS